jgi:rare lipoprotein A (peptidoglycan hydrolase)
VARALAAARLLWRAGTVPLIRLLLSLLLIGSIGASLVACGSGNGERLGERVIPLGQPVPKGGGRYVTGAAYRVDGVWYQPREDSTYDRVGTASWYGELFHGRRTANGEIYDMDRLSAASPTLPMPVYARVTNLENRRSIIVRVNDRGPYRSDRIIDLSRRSAEVLGFRGRGTAPVRVQYLARAPLNGDDSYERRYLASQGWAQFASQGRATVPGVGALLRARHHRSRDSCLWRLPAERCRRGKLPRAGCRSSVGRRAPAYRLANRPESNWAAAADFSFRPAPSGARITPSGRGRCLAA